MLDCAELIYLLGSVELETQQAAFAAAEEPTSVQLDVAPPIPSIPETVTYVSSHIQTPGNGETKEQLRSPLGDIQAEEANRRLEEPTSVELEVAPPIPDIPETATYVSTPTQTAANGETKEQLRSLLRDIRAEEANRQLEEQTQLIRQLLTQQWETAEEQRRSSLSAPFQRIVALVVIFISIASFVAALWIGKVQIDLAQHSR
jgi:hypothetical protein